MHTCGRMCKDIGVKTTFPRTMGISFRLHPERSRVHPERSRGLHPEQSRVHPERSRVHPERSRGVEVYALNFSSRLRSTNSLSGPECTPSGAEGCTPSEAECTPSGAEGVGVYALDFSSRLRSTNSLSRAEFTPSGAEGCTPIRAEGCVCYLNTRTCPPFSAPPSFSGPPIATLVPSPDILTLDPNLSSAAIPSISVLCCIQFSPFH